LRLAKEQISQWHNFLTKICLCLISLGCCEIYSRRTHFTIWSIKLICAHLDVLLLLPGSIRTSNAKIPLVEKIFDNYSDGSIHHCILPCATTCVLQSVQFSNVFNLLDNFPCLCIFSAFCQFLSKCVQSIKTEKISKNWLN
jgi:hypothetical protein